MASQEEKCTVFREWLGRARKLKAVGRKAVKLAKEAEEETLQERLCTVTLLHYIAGTLADRRSTNVKKWNKLHKYSNCFKERRSFTVLNMQIEGCYTPMVEQKKKTVQFFF